MGFLAPFLFPPLFLFPPQGTEQTTAEGGDWKNSLSICSSSREKKNLNLPKQGGFAIPAGSDLFLSVWNLHRDPARWKDADEFIPERFGPVDDVVAVRAGAGCPQSGSPPSPSAASDSASSPSSSSYVVPNEITESFSYLPFGGGKRKCIGDQFALFESVTALAIFARRVSL